MSVFKVSRREAECTFQACDDGDKGFLNKEDYKTAVISLFGLMPTDSEIEEVFSPERGESKDGEFSLKKDEFTNLMIWRSGSALNCYNYERLLFDCLDPLQAGFIKIEEFEKAVRRYYPKARRAFVQEVFDKIDLDCDSKLSYREFTLFLQQSADTLTKEHS